MSATADRVQERTISHTGSVLGSNYVTTSQNQVSPQLETPIIGFECPKKFERIEWVGQRDAIRAELRYMETFDGDGVQTDFALTGDVMPVAGETDLSEQPYPAAVAYDTDAGGEVTVDSIDYATNTVTLASAPNSATGNVKIYPVLSEGTIKVRGLNQFDQVEGYAYQWSTPIYRFNDFNQLQRGREVNLHGSATWGRYETVEFVVDSPRQVEWDESDFPQGAYSSTFEVDVMIDLG